MKKKEIPDWLSRHLIKTTTPCCYQPFDHSEEPWIVDLVAVSGNYAMVIGKEEKPFIVSVNELSFLYLGKEFVEKN